MLLAGCQDTEFVQHAAITAAGRFQVVEDNHFPLSSLTEALSGESVSTAYAVAHLPGALGASLAGNTTQGLQDHIIEELVHALKDSNSQREVLITNDVVYSRKMQAGPYIYSTGRAALAVGSLGFGKAPVASTTLRVSSVISSASTR